MVPAPISSSFTRFLALGVFAHAILGVACRSESSTKSVVEAGPRTVSVAAASDLKFALEDVLTAFRTAHPDIRVDATYGSSGNFFAQLQNRAPFDVFLSADVSFPKKLAEGGLTQKGSEFVYAHGRVVLWVPASSTLDVEKLGMRALVDPGARKIAMANPEHAPYGRAAEAAIKQAGLYDQVKPKLVLGENIAQTAQFAESGAADVALIAMSLARSGPMKSKGHYWEVPPDSYPTLEQGGTVMSWAKDPRAAGEVCAFLTSPQGKSILQSYGFVVPP